MNFTMFMRATPAGTLMNVRTTGSSRDPKTVTLAVVLEPGMGPVHLVGADQQVPAEPIHQRPPPTAPAA